jgi:hypothetical protein
LRKLSAALSLGCALAAPAVAAGLDDQLNWLVGHRAPAAMQSEWQPVEPVRQPGPWMTAVRRGEGWASLDGWMRGDPVLRAWVVFRFDADADGWLSADEAEAARTAFYAMADLNGSGRMTSEEFVVGWAKARAELDSLYAG